MPALPGDLSPIAELLTDCGLPAQDITQSLLDHFWVAREGRQLIGVVGLEICGRFALLRSLAVSAEQRGQGVGTRLTARAEAHARPQRISAIYLLTTTAHFFFAGRGYRQVERDQAPAEIQSTAEFRAICPISAVLMSKDLGAADPAARYPRAAWTLRTDRSTGAEHQEEYHAMGRTDCNRI
jgi:amino-acid N-acetyltransferase